jgi:hypothetical protein
VSRGVLPRALASLPRRGERLWPLATGFALAAAALDCGRIAAFVIAPLALGLGLLGARAAAAADAARAWIGGGLASSAAGFVLLFVGGDGAALAAFLLGIVVTLCGVRASLLQEPTPAGVPAPCLGVGLAAAVIADEAAALLREGVRLVQPRPDFARIAADVRAAADRNRERGWLEHPEQAYLPPPPLEKYQLERVDVRGAGSAEELRFHSEFEPLDPEVRRQFLAVDANRTARVHLWRHRGEPRPTLLCLHGHRQGRIGLDARTWDVRWLHGALGLDVALYTLPLHGARATGWHSGAGFLDGHPGVTSAALAQIVWELRRFAGWLRGQGGGALGIAGFDVGGHAAALFASLESGLASAVLFAPVASLDAYAWRLMPAGRRAEARAAGLTEHWLSAAWARHAPLNLRPQLPHASRLVVGGLVDRSVPPSQVAALWEHWGRPASHWCPGSHRIWRGRRELREHLAAHLRATLAA